MLSLYRNLVKFFIPHRFRQEIMLALFLKIMGLILLWNICFSHAGLILDTPLLLKHYMH